MDKKLLNKIPRRIEASMESGKAKLFLAGTVGSWYDGITFKDVRTALSEISDDSVEVHINSYGGDMFEGIAIKNYLKQLDKTITVVIDGIAASAASVIAMAGDEILMPKDTQLMIHNPWTWAAGNAKELRKIADDLDKSQTSIEESYLAHFKGSREELQSLLDEETSLTAEEAVALGLADSIIDDVSEEPANDDSAEGDVSVREALLAKYGGKVAASVPQATDDNPKEPSSDGLVNFMKLFQ